MAQAQRQLGLYEGEAPTTAPAGPPQSLLDPLRGRQLPQVHRRLCAGCRAKEARYGFRPEGEDDPTLDRPRALCFECFRVEVTRRQLVRERMARGWNAQQAGLPLQDTLRALDTRRRRAQIAARHAPGAEAWP
jgi:hypothetical protein